MAGKADWFAAGLPREGGASGRPTAASVAKTDVVTGRLGDTVAELRERARAAGHDLAVVTTEHGVVLGLLRREHLDGAEGSTAEDAMQPGPSTFRPNVPIAEMAEYMTKHDLDSAPITTSDGKLVGVLFRDDAERAAERS